MDDHYRIRAGRAADLADVTAIERASFPDPWSESLLVEELRRESLVVEYDAEIVGYLFLRHTWDDGEILNVAVVPAHRGRGIGRRLVEAAFERLRAAGARRVYLEVRESNVEALGFYRVMGFRAIGRRSRYYRNPPEPALVLTRELSASGGTA